MDEMPCRELVEVVTDYLEGALPRTDRVRFEAHLEECEACRDYVEQLRDTIRLAGRIEPEQLSPATRVALQRAFDGWRAAG
jgi:predicted anti-sigma-YlaC factor YlaD